MTSDANNPKHASQTERCIIGLSRIIPGHLLLNGYTSMEFITMIEQVMADA